MKSRHTISGIEPSVAKTGMIKRRELNKIFPQYKIEIRNRGDAIRMLKHLIDIENDGDWAGQDAMSIRTYCKIFRKASETFFHQQHDERLDDIDYYRQQKSDNIDGFDPDSVIDFKRFASGSYGELGLSQIHIKVIDDLTDGRSLIVIEMINTTFIAEGIELALALYDGGIEFKLADADKILSMVDESDNVHLCKPGIGTGDRQNSNWDILMLPDIAAIRQEDEIAGRQYEELVRMAEWEL